MPNHRLLAWIEPKDDHYTAALVTAVAHRLPATRDCGSVEEARAWVESEAAALHVPVIWTGHPTARPRTEAMGALPADRVSRRRQTVKPPKGGGRDRLDH